MYFTCYFNFLSSYRTILKGGIKISWDSGMRSILKSISLSGGTMGRSSWKYFCNSLTTDTKSRVGVSKFEFLHLNKMIDIPFGKDFPGLKVRDKSIYRH